MPWSQLSLPGEALFIPALIVVVVLARVLGRRIARRRAQIPAGERALVRLASALGVGGAETKVLRAMGSGFVEPAVLLVSGPAFRAAAARYRESDPAAAAQLAGLASRLGYLAPDGSAGEPSSQARAGSKTGGGIKLSPSAITALAKALSGMITGRKSGAQSQRTGSAGKLGTPIQAAVRPSAGGASQRPAARRPGPKPKMPGQ